MFCLFFLLMCFQVQAQTTNENNPAWPNQKKDNLSHKTIQTQKPFYECLQNGSVLLHCDTPGARIFYLLSNKKVDKITNNENWQAYKKEPVFIPDGKVLNVMAIKSGYKLSEIIALSYTEN